MSDYETSDELPDFIWYLAKISMWFAVVVGIGLMVVMLVSGCGRIRMLPMEFDPSCEYIYGKPSIDEPLGCYCVKQPGYRQVTYKPVHKLRCK